MTGGRFALIAALWAAARAAALTLPALRVCS